MKIVVLDGYTLNPGDISWQRFEQLGELTVYDRTSPELILDRLSEAEIVFTNKTALTRETLESCPSIRYIGVLATGYNVVDVDAAREKNIPVCNIPTYGTSAVAQFAFALLLELCHHVGHHNTSVQEGRWEQSSDFCFWDYPLVELMGKTMGIIGYGRIGQATASIARAFGMKVLAYDAFVSAPECVPLQELLATSDVISLHCPLFPNTKGIINKDTIAAMKTGVMLINTSRGPLINETDLREALLSGKVAGAAVDVVTTEPIRADNPLLGLENCLITPHIAWAPRESRQRLMDVAADNLQAFLSGKPQNVVNG